MAADAPNIEALTRGIIEGDNAAFCRFYDLYSFRLYCFLLVLTRGDENEAREVCQTVFIKLARRFKVFDEERALWAWLCVVARNAFLDRCRVRARDLRLVPIEDLPASFEGGQGADDRLTRMLLDALSALPPEERELMQAAYIDEIPLQALADKSGQTYKAIACRLARLRHRLREQLLKSLRHEDTR